MSSKEDSADLSGGEKTTIALEAEALVHAADAARREIVDTEATPTEAADADPGETLHSVSAQRPAAAARTDTQPRAATVAGAADLPPAATAGATVDPAATTELPVPVEEELADQAEQSDVCEIVDEAAEDVEAEWSLADQPTIFLSVRPPNGSGRPAYLETGERPSWPPRPTASPAPIAGHTPPPGRAGGNPHPTLRAMIRPTAPKGRLPSPSGRLTAGTWAANSDPRLRRLEALRRQRLDQRESEAAPDENAAPVAQVVRKLWGDLMPGLQRALHYQHEARASGSYPIPATEPNVTTRLGDAFGRLAAAVRDLSERAQSAAGPALTRLHDRAEHVAQALVDRFEGPAARQQAPLLGPGRLAVFFQQGVTVGDAQRLLVASRARPLRLIPRRHGFLALVQPGREPEVGEQLRQHPYVRDVVYLEYDEHGQPLTPR